MQTVANSDLCELVRVIQSEYFALPGLHLSKTQAQRLWNLDDRTINTVFTALEASHFLKRLPNGAYVRADCEPEPLCGL